MGNDFGPNSVEVESFLSSLARMSDDQWQEVLAKFRRSRGSFFALISDWITWRLAWGAVSKAGRLSAKEAALRAARAHGFDDTQDKEPYDRMTIVGSALFALVVRNAIATKHFSTLYRPFSGVIPLERLK